jgi:hypothetical protein
MNANTVEERAAAFHKAVGAHSTAVAQVIRGESHSGRSLEALAAAVRDSKRTVLEKAEAVEAYRQLRAGAPNARHAHSGGKPQCGVSATAKELILSRRAVDRYRAIAGIAPEAKRAAIAEGLANKQSALEIVAEAPPEQQVDMVHEVAERQHEGPGREERARKEFEGLLRMWRRANALAKHNTAAVALLGRIELALGELHESYANVCELVEAASKKV